MFELWMVINNFVDRHLCCVVGRLKNDFLLHLLMIKDKTCDILSIACLNRVIYKGLIYLFST